VRWGKLFQKEKRNKFKGFSPPKAAFRRGRFVAVVRLAEIKVDCRGQNCPVPLVETRKALKKAAPGDVVEVTGDHPASKKEIPMAVKALGLELLEVESEEGGEWRIRIRR
jgi:tRNA 2-thiouridine synthesizing protein A